MSRAFCASQFGKLCGILPEIIREQGAEHRKVCKFYHYLFFEIVKKSLVIKENNGIIVLITS